MRKLLIAGLMTAVSLTSIAADHRSDKNKARDQFRNPEKTLEFFEVKADSRVVEISPGGGWYTEVLAPKLNDKGMLYAAHFAEDAGHEYYKKSLARYKEKLKAHPEVYGNIKITTMQPPKTFDLAPAGSATHVLTFRNVHNWMRNEGDQKAFNEFFKALKPGGVLGVVEHRAPETFNKDQMIKSGYVSESYVIKLAEKAGFKLAGKSEVNANSKDTKDHPKGVWTLPPSLRLGDEKRDYYQSIGESDRMTLKFVKPAS